MDQTKETVTVPKPLNPGRSELSTAAGHQANLFFASRLLALYMGRGFGGFWP